MLGSPCSSSSFSDSIVALAPRHAARMRFRLENGGRFGEAGGLFDQGGVQQRGEMVAERMHVRPRGLGAGFWGSGHAR